MTFPFLSQSVALIKMCFTAPLRCTYGAHFPSTSHHLYQWLHLGRNAQLTEILWKINVKYLWHLKKLKITFYEVILKIHFFIDSIFIMRKFHWKWRKSLFSMSVAYRSENFIWLNSKLPFHIIYSALELEPFFLFFCIYFIEHLPTHQIVHQKTFSLAN